MRAEVREKNYAYRVIQVNDDILWFYVFFPPTRRSFEWKFMISLRALFVILCGTRVWM